MCERVEGVQRLATVIDALDAVDPHALTDDELHNVVTALQRETSRLAAVTARQLATWDARRIWSDDGSKSAAARLAREGDVSKKTARRQLKRARKLKSMPATAAALREGKISADQADALAYANQPAVASLFARDEAMLVDTLKGLGFADGVRALRYWLELAHEEVGHTPESVKKAGRHFHAVRTFNANVDLSGNLEPIGGTEFLSEYERLDRELFEADWAAAREIHGDDVRVEHLARTPAQRHADALVEMARRSRSTQPGAQRPRPLITVLGGYGAFSRMCELADGTVVSPESIVPLLTDADIERIVFDGPSRVIDVGVRQRFFTGALRRAIEVRDRHCQHPSGCDVPAERCDIDHIVAYAEGGETTQDNGRLLCGFHNRLRERQRERPPPG